MKRNFLKKNASRPVKAGIFLSGTGSNAARILELYYKNKTGDGSKNWLPVVLVTDRNDSAAERLGAQYGLPVVQVNIADFYRRHGLETTSIATEKGQEVRRLWTDALRAALKEYELDFGIFAGFVPLTDIVDDFPCLNVHPGDLLVEENGQRVLVGLHTIPVEAALIRRKPYLRSSVIVIQNSRIANKKVDCGALLGVSTPVPVDWTDELTATVEQCVLSRQGKKRAEYKNDALAQTAKEYQNKLKEGGDWIVFPPVVDEFAVGHYSYDEETDTLYYKDKAVATVEFGIDSIREMEK